MMAMIVEMILEVLVEVLIIDDNDINLFWHWLIPQHYCFSVNWETYG